MVIMENIYPKCFSVDLLVAPCNNDCRHCYSHVVKSVGRPGYDDIVRVISKLRESLHSEFAMSPWCLMHEPLLIKDLPRLVTYIKKEWPEATDGLVSNLSGATPSLMDALWEAGIRKLQFSFYGVGAVHDAFAGRRGAYADVMRALPILIKRGFSLRPVVWLHRRIGPSLPELANIWKKYSFKSDGDGRLPAKLFSPIGGVPDCLDWVPSFEDLSDYKEFLPEGILTHTEAAFCKEIVNSHADEKKDTASPQDYSLPYTVFPDGTVYEFWAPIHDDFKLGNIFLDGIDMVHERYYSEDYPGAKKISFISDKQAVAACGNTSSTRLFQDADIMAYYYKLKNLGYLGGK